MAANCGIGRSPKLRPWHINDQFFQEAPVHFRDEAWNAVYAKLEYSLSCARLLCRIGLRSLMMCSQKSRSLRKPGKKVTRLFAAVY